VAQPPETSVVEHEVRVAAQPEVVFSYFTDPAKMVRWMGSEATLDPRPGGMCRIVFRPSEPRAEFLRTTYGAIDEPPTEPTETGDAGVISGNFVEVEPYRRIALTWGWEQELFAMPPASTAVEVSFESEAGATLVRLTHRRLPAPAVEFHRAGWEHYLPRLAITAAGGDPGPDPWSADEPRA
jgi:uncharacterized protein YndB with AHSA1/START domain